MLCYYAVFPTKNLNQDILIDFLWDWLEHSKNKMEGLYIEKTFPFEYEVDHKHLKLQIFDEKYFHLYKILLMKLFQNSLQYGAAWTKTLTFIHQTKFAETKNPPVRFS